MTDIRDIENTSSLEDLAEQVGTLFYNWGLKRIQGRMWTVIFLAKEPLDARRICKILSISKALVSISLKELKQIDAVRIAGKSDAQMVTYVANADIASIVLAVIKQRELLLFKQLHVAQKAFMNVEDSELERFGVCSEKLNSLGLLIGKSNFAFEKLVASADNRNV